jgi:hypothetical protein
MSKPKLTRRRKLLTTAAGVTGVTYLLCGPIACNLVPPPPCAAGEDPCMVRCRPADGGFVNCEPDTDAGTDAGTDGGNDGDGGQRDQ